MCIVSALRSFPHSGLNKNDLSRTNSTPNDSNGCKLEVQTTVAIAQADFYSDASILKKQQRQSKMTEPRQLDSITCDDLHSGLLMDRRVKVRFKPINQSLPGRPAASFGVSDSQRRHLLHVTFS